MRVKMKKNILKLDLLCIVGKFNIDYYIVLGTNRHNILNLILTKNKITELCNLPSEIQFINFYYNNIEILDNLPFNLKNKVFSQ